MTTATGFLHMVYFWMREGAEDTDALKLAAGCRTYLAAIPTVLRLEVGFPAGTQRDVVDNSYGVGLMVEFADAEGHAVYHDHPDHLRFIEQCSPLWSRVQVYDTHICR